MNDEASEISQMDVNSELVSHGNLETTLDIFRETAKKIILTILSICLIVLLVCYTYFGSLFYLQVSLHEIIHTCVCGISNIFAGRSTEVIHVILWCVWSLGHVSVVIDLDIRMLVSFFRNLSGFCSLSNMSRFIVHVVKHRRENTLRAWLCRGAYVLISAAVIVGFGFLQASSGMRFREILGDITGVGEIIFILLVMMVAFQPVIALAHVMLDGWRVLLRKTEEQRCELHSQLLDDRSAGDIDVSDIHGENLSLCDPSRVNNVQDWLAFLESEDNCLLALRRGRFDKGLVAGAVSLLCQATYVAMDVVLTVSGTTVGNISLLGSDVTTLTKTFGIIFMIVRSSFAVFMTPISMSLTPLILIFKSKSVKKYKRIYRVMIISLVLHGLFVLLFAACAVYVSCFFRPAVIKQYVPSGGREYENITSSPSAAVCVIGIGNFSLLDFAAVNVLSSISDETVRHNVSLDLFPYFGGGGAPVEEMYDTSTDFAMYRLARAGEKEEIIGFEGLRTGVHAGIFIEQIVGYWMRRGLRCVIPFYELFEKESGSLFHKTLHVVILRYQYICEEFTGLKSVTVLVNKEAYRKRISSIHNNESELYFAGHSSGGLFAKYFMEHMAAKAMVFESPLLDSLTVFGFSRTSENQFINVYSPGSFFSMTDSKASLNVEIPSAQTFLDPANPYETFCQIAAGCVNDARYDYICSSLVGVSAYQSYFDRWARNRSTISY